MSQPAQVSGRVRDFVVFVDKGILRFSRHWLSFTNLLALLFGGLPVLAPFLVSQGNDRPASVIYFLYRLTCHQYPSRSFFVFGHQMAYCQRDFAIYTTVLIAGVGFAFVRRRVKPLNWRLYIVLILPMAVDGLTQLVGLRESTWELRIVTGVLFGFGSVWLFYPYLETGMREVRQTLEDRFAQLKLRQPS